MAATHAVGSKVWVRDEAEAWQKAEVLRIDGGLLVVKLTEKAGLEAKAKAEDVPLQNPDVRGVEVS